MKAIIFDFDGVIHDTLIDLYEVHCETLEKLTLEEMKNNVFNGNPRKYLEKFTNKEKNDFEKSWNKHYNTLKLKTNIRKELLLLSKKYLLFIISSNTENNLNQYFKNNNFTNIFEKIYGVETDKSKINKFKILFNEYKLKNDDCIFITDTLGDILEANNVGLKTIAVEFGFHDKEKLKKGNPFKIISKFEEIKDIVSKI